MIVAHMVLKMLFCFAVNMFADLQQNLMNRQNANFHLTVRKLMVLIVETSGNSTYNRSFQVSKYPQWYIATKEVQTVVAKSVM